MTKASFDQQNYMKNVSAQEAQYYVNNGMFPYDQYITNQLKSSETSEDIDKGRKNSSNRQEATLLLANIPIIKFLLTLFFNNDSFIPAADGSSWRCTNDGNLEVNKDGNIQVETDYSYFQNNIPNFTFTNGSCNVCELKKQPYDLSKPYTITDAYNNSTCKFKVGDQNIPEAWDVFSGSWGTAPSSETAAPISQTDNLTNGEVNASANEYQKCVSSCDQYKT